VQKELFKIKLNFSIKNIFSIDSPRLITRDIKSLEIVLPLKFNQSIYLCNTKTVLKWCVLDYSSIFCILAVEIARIVIKTSDFEIIYMKHFNVSCNISGEAPGGKLHRGRYKISKIINTQTKSIPFASLLGKLRKSLLK